MSVQNPLIDCICTQHSALSTQHSALSTLLYDWIESTRATSGNQLEQSSKSTAGRAILENCRTDTRRCTGCLCGSNPHRQSPVQPRPKRHSLRLRLSQLPGVLRHWRDTHPLQSV